MGIINILIAAGLALLYPGAGQIYNGQTKKGFWFFGIGITLWILSETVFTRLWFEWIIRLFQLWTVIDAIVVASGFTGGKETCPLCGIGRGL
jgi:TM2 domain-containing membrane protein YozV